MKKLNFIEEKEFEVAWTSKIPSHMIEDEEFLRPQYKPQHPLELETKKFIKDKEHIQNGDVLMGLCEEDLKAMELFQHETTYHNHFNFFSISVIRMKRDVFETLKSGLKRYIEFTEKELHDGINYQGEIRQYSKDYISSMNENGEIVYGKGKVPMNSSKIENALSFMKKMAILVIEREFELRFKNFKNCHDVEQESWAYQLPEAREYKNNPESKTPFLDILAMTRGMDKKNLVDKILKKHDKYVREYASLLGKYHAIRSQFKTVDNMWDMNILYEDYLNIGMPVVQAQKLGRLDKDLNRLSGELAYGTFGF